MNERTAPIGIRDWQPEHRREPLVRIGIVLDVDELQTLELEIPANGRRLIGADGPGRTIQAGRVVASRVGDTVSVRVGDTPEEVSTCWQLMADSAEASGRGVGVRVSGVVAGRGFHWQKRTDQTLGGGVELRAGGQGLILVNELPLEDYLAGVITAEMSGQCPLEFLKAQCIVARSWLLAFSEPKHEDSPFDRCNDDCCQRYQGTDDLSTAATAAVNDTRGQVLLNTTGAVVDANYSKSCGGVSEQPEHVWDRPKPGLSAIVDAPQGSSARAFLPVTEANLDEYLDGPWLRDTEVYCSPNVVAEERFAEFLGRVDEVASYFRWTVCHRREELEGLLRSKLPEASDLVCLRDLRVLERGVSGRAKLIELEFGERSGQRRQVQVRSEYRIRQVLHQGFLYSSAFTVRIERDGDGTPRTVTLCGAGWGHGAGFCQIGGLGMALRGLSSEPILSHYFPETTLRRAY
ncbi:MAG: SpoIID/LytB domain-containing protein [bacterium]|nr:SpoIID/LytB domain-containing protein [bacterium]